MSKHRLKYKKFKKSSDELERAYDKIIAWFFAYPQDELSLSDLSKQLKISKTSANVAVIDLEKLGFLEKKVLGRIWRIKAILTHPFFITKKISQNLMHIYESGVVDEIRRQIPNAKSLILFGSYRKGDDLPESDVDIAVEIMGNNPLEIIKFGSISQLGYRKNVIVNLHIFTRNQIDLNTFANIANGIVLFGFLEVRP